MTLESALELAVGFFVALVVASLVEYWGHRLMHDGKILKVRHARHHRNAAGQGWLGEFKDYFVPGLGILWVGFLISVPAGIGFALGATLFAAFAAYAHQVQHERPELVFWLPRPIHYLHHRENMWRHNFGISLDVWDRVFGTYKVVAWDPESDSAGGMERYLDIRWS